MARARALGGQTYARRYTRRRRTRPLKTYNIYTYTNEERVFLVHIKCIYKKEKYIESKSTRC